jgi:hypothetical protein
MMYKLITEYNDKRDRIDFIVEEDDGFQAPVFYLTEELFKNVEPLMIASMLGPRIQDLMNTAYKRGLQDGFQLVSRESSRDSSL